MTAIYSILHLLVDGVCALAMFGTFLSGEDGRIYILLYNFCAFALQMPFGVALDALYEREGGQRDYAFLFAAAGVLCTMAGAVTHPAVLGIGNALFHVGGGVGTIREDDARGWRGRGLGVFVAPGALGLYLGTLLGKSGGWWTGFLGFGVLLAAFCAGGVYGMRHGGKERKGSPREKEDSSENLPIKGTLWTAFCCILVVILRSYVGLAVTFPWKQGVLAGMLAVFAVVGGKVAGGFAAARCGFSGTTAVSLGLAAFCYLFSAVMPLGLAALFLFNMTMPITLYEMVSRMPRMPGFAFGLLTFALFLGFLPVYFGGLSAVSRNVLGCAGSVVSLLLLWAGIRTVEKRVLKHK